MFTIEQLSALGISIDEIRSGVIESIKEEILPEIKKEMATVVTKELRGVIAGKTSEWVTNALNRGIQPLNSWGEPSGPPTTVQAIIEKKAAEFMAEKVDDNGKVNDSYRNETPRYLWAAKKIAQEALEKELRSSLDKVIVEMKAEVQSGITNVVADLVARNFSRR